MLHGTVEDPESIVLTTEGYRQLLNSHESYSMFLKTLMSTRTILYVGFSFSDGYLNELRSQVMSMLREGAQEGDEPIKPLAYAIINDKEQSDVDFYFEHEGVQLLTWDTVSSEPQPLIFSVMATLTLSLVYTETPRFWCSRPNHVRN